MASFESSDPQKSNGKSDSNVRLISLSSEVNFDWSLFVLEFINNQLRLTSAEAAVE